MTTQEWKRAPIPTKAMKIEDDHPEVLPTKRKRRNPATSTFPVPQKAKTGLQTSQKATKRQKTEQVEDGGSF